MAKPLKKWSPAATKVYHRTFRLMMANQELFLHPKVTKMPKAIWETTAHNAAWIAADVYDGRM